jgi:hypothetical protein
MGFVSHSTSIDQRARVHSPVLYATSMHNEDLQAPDTTGTGAVTDVEYIPYHVCRSETVTHTIYYDA